MRFRCCGLALLSWSALALLSSLSACAPFNSTSPTSSLTGSWYGTSSLDDGVGSITSYFYLDIQEGSGGALAGSSMTCTALDQGNQFSFTGNRSGSAVAMTVDYLGHPTAYTGTASGDTLRLSSQYDSPQGGHLTFSAALQRGSRADFASACKRVK